MKKLIFVFIAIILTLYGLYIIGRGGYTEKIPVEEIEVKKIFQYEYDDKKGIFIVTKTPTYQWGQSVIPKYGRRKVEINYYHRVHAPKVKNNGGELNSPFIYNLKGQTKVVLNGKEIWDAEKDVSVYVPDYVIAFARWQYDDLRSADDVTDMYSFWDESNIGFIDGQGKVIVWDWDGNVLYDRNKK